MRVKVSKQQVLKNNYRVLSVGFCELQGLLKNSYSQFYSAGVYGWSCDYYEFDNLTISTGYSPIGSNIDYKIIKVYENKANKINHNNDLTWEQREKKLKVLLNKFIKEVKSLLS
jgi:hypothetical protein